MALLQYIDLAHNWYPLLCVVAFFVIAWLRYPLWKKGDANCVAVQMPEFLRFFLDFFILYICVSVIWAIIWPISIPYLWLRTKP